MRASLTLLFLLTASFLMFAQPETKKSGEFKLENYKAPTPEKSKPEVEAPAPPETPRVSLGLKTAEQKREEEYLKKFIVKKEEKVEPIMVEKSKSKYDYNEEMKKKLNGQKQEPKVGNSKNQYLGEIRTNSFFVKIACRDHQDPDGDLVSIVLNDTILVESMSLESGFKVVFTKLKKGKNKLEFIALNQGTSGPNTAAFNIYDEFDAVLSSNEWNLNTGVRAIVYIINEDKKVVEKKEIVDPNGTNEEEETTGQ